MFVVPFFAFMLGLVHHVFHLLVEVQHFQIESEQAFLLVNQWDKEGIDDDGGEDDRKDDVPYKHGGFQIGDVDEGLCGQHCGGQSLGIECRHENQFLFGDAFLFGDGETHRWDTDDE